jgi:hypothetical protein
MSSNNITTESSLNEQIQKTILLSGTISMSIVLLVIITIIIYCVIKNKRDANSNDNLNSFSANKIIAKNLPLNKNPNFGFKSLQNSSSLGNENQNNMSLSEIKERNIKDEIHNIIHGNNNESGIQKKSKKKNKNKKNASELIEEISSQNDTKDLEDNIKNQIKQFVRDDDEKK